MPEYFWRRVATASWLEAREARLLEVTKGALAIIERPGRTRILLEAPGRNARLLREFGGKFLRLPSLPRAPIKPIRIGRRLIIREDGAGSADTLIIPAGLAFGTGEHVTTAMSLRILERATRGLTSGWRMLDAGTGSGILALAGKRFGAQHVLAIDHDPRAIATAKENARRNRIPGVKFVRADVMKSAGKFDLVAANLYSDLLIAALPRFRGASVLILSGITRQQEREVLRALKANCFRPREIRRRGKWIALRATAMSEEKRG